MPSPVGVFCAVLKNKTKSSQATIKFRDCFSLGLCNTTAG